MSKFNDNNQYDWFKDLMFYFQDDTYLDDKRPENLSPKEFSVQRDLATIKRYIDESDTNYIRKAIKQAREILALEEFPWEWVGDTANRMPISKNFPFKRWDDVKSEDYYEWITWIIDELEKHAKLAGKFVAEAPEIEKDRQNKTVSKDSKDLKLPGFGLDSRE